MAGSPWHYFKAHYVVVIIIMVSIIIIFSLAQLYYGGGIDIKNGQKIGKNSNERDAVIDLEDSSDTKSKKEEIVIEQYFLFYTVDDLKYFLKNRRHEMDLAAEKAFAAHGFTLTAEEIKNRRSKIKCKFSNIC